MFNYICAVCGKKMLHMKNGEIQVLKDEDSGRVVNTKSLGTWKCVCGNRKVKRVKNAD